MGAYIKTEILWNSGEKCWYMTKEKGIQLKPVKENDCYLFSKHVMWRSMAVSLAG